MFSRLLHRASHRSSQTFRRSTRARIRFEALEGRRLFAADAFLGAAEMSSTMEVSTTGGDANSLPIGGDGVDVLRGGAGNDVLIGGRGNDVVLGQDGSDLLIINDGNESDSSGARLGGGPHVKVFDGTTSQTDNGVVDAADYTVWRDNHGDATNVDAVYSELGNDPESDPPPTEELALNYAKI